MSMNLEFIREERHEPRRPIYYAQCCRIWPCVEYPPLPFLRTCGFCREVPVKMSKQDPLHPINFKEWKQWRNQDIGI